MDIFFSVKWGHYQLTDIPMKAVYLKLKPDIKSSEMALLKGDIGLWTAFEESSDSHLTYLKQ